MTKADVVCLIIILLCFVVFAVVILLPYKYYTISDTLRIREVSTVNYKNEVVGVRYILEIKDGS